MKKISQFDTITARNNDDWLLIEEASTGAYKKIKVSDFIAGLGGSQTSPSVPIAPVGDPYFANAILLIHFNGANNSTSFVDVKGKTIITHGTTKISANQNKFGSTSGVFDGSGYLSLNNGTDFDFGVDDFTIEFFAYQISNTGIQNIIKGDSSSTATGVEIANGKPRLWLDGIGPICESPNSLSLNDWSHIAIVRNNNNFINFVNGVSVANDSNTSIFRMIGTEINIGRGFYNTNYFGYLDEFRITKGTARYTSDFAVPVAAFLDW